jgi:hypothetical protein
MMILVKVKKLLFYTVLFFSFSLFAPKNSYALDLQDVLTSEDSVIVKIQEGLEYFFAFSVENKINVLEKHAEKRLVSAQELTDDGNGENVQDKLQDYLRIKEKQDGLLGKIDNEGVLGAVAERTIDQQKTMEEIKMRVDVETKQQVVQTQERVVNQVAKRVVEVNGSGGQTEFFQRVEHVWAPGTGPGGEAGVVVEGGAMQFAPGTSAGGPSGSDIKTVEVVTGGGENNAEEVGESGGGFAPGTTQGGNAGNTVNHGTVDTNNSSGDDDWVIDP